MYVFLKILLVAATSYCLGSIPSSYCMGKLLKGIDLREHGSGNLGAANTYRVLGLKAAVPVLLFDIGKGFVAVHYLSRLGRPRRRHRTQLLRFCSFFRRQGSRRHRGSVSRARAASPRHVPCPLDRRSALDADSFRGEHGERRMPAGGDTDREQAVRRSRALFDHRARRRRGGRRIREAPLEYRAVAQRHGKKDLLGGNPYDGKETRRFDLHSGARRGKLGNDARDPAR
jgi:hypothetical protein